MARNEANRVWVTHRTNYDAEQLMHTQNALTAWQGGFEVRLGHMFCCGQWAIEGSYWRLADMYGFSEVENRDYTSAPDGFSYSTPLNFNWVIWADGVPGSPIQIFDFARQHRLWRTNSFQNLEINLIRHQLVAECANTLTIDWSVGVRYFQFDERLRFGALQQNIPPFEQTHTWGEAGGVFEAYLDETIHNALVGCQFGVNASFPVERSLRLFLAPKVGIFNNHIEHRFAGYRGDGLRFAPDPASGITGQFPVSATTDVLSFLTEVNVGLDWNFARGWDAFIGYRVIWATGIGLADNQILPYVADIPAHAHIEHNGELVLHGAFAGVTFSF